MRYDQNFGLDGYLTIMSWHPPKVHVGVPFAYAQGMMGSVATLL